jgi:hypothetical protein
VWNKETEAGMHEWSARVAEQKAIQRAAWRAGVLARRVRTYSSWVGLMGSPTLL